MRPAGAAMAHQLAVRIGGKPRGHLAFLGAMASARS